MSESHAVVVVITAAVLSVSYALRKKEHLSIQPVLWYNRLAKLSQIKVRDKKYQRTVMSEDQIFAKNVAMNKLLKTRVRELEF